MATNDAKLVERCLAGDESSLREFVDLFQHSVYLMCYRLLNHREDAEDVAQESLMRAVKYLKSWNSSQPLHPWIMKIASNRCRTHAKKRPKTKVLFEHDSLAKNSEQESVLLAEEIQVALQVLSEKHRVCFVLFYQQDLSILEISETLKIPEGTVKTWLFRSRGIIAQHLRERGLSPIPPSRERSDEV